jgi:hypothetical protein
VNAGTFTLWKKKGPLIIQQREQVQKEIAAHYYDYDLWSKAQLHYILPPTE